MSRARRRRSARKWPEFGEVLDDWHPLASAPGVVFGGGPVQPNAAICLGHGRPGAPPVASYYPGLN